MVGKFPAIPMRGLWDLATVEEREKAKQTAQAIMEYWMGYLTKRQATEKLNLTPVRFWQLTSQAVAGMTAGLLTQPRYRKADYMGKSEQQQIKQLRAKVRDLEQMVSSQQKVIEIMKSMPGIGEVNLDDGDKKSKSRVHRRVQKQDRSVSERGSTREPGENSQDLGCNDKDAKVVEKRLQ